MSDKYRKIHTVWKRDKENKMVIMRGEFSLDIIENIKCWSLTEKVDGQCMTVVVTKDNIKVFGKSEKTKFNSAHEPLLSYIDSRFTRERLDRILDYTKADKFIFYGEGYGPKIQKGGKYLKEGQKFILFDMVIDGIWMEEENVTEFASWLDIPRVSLLGKVCNTYTTEQFVTAKPLSLISEQDPPCIIEGIVARAYPMVLHRFERTPVMFKLKVEDYDKLKVLKNGKD